VSAHPNEIAKAGSPIVGLEQPGTRAALHPLKWIGPYREHEQYAPGRAADGVVLRVLR